MMRDSLAKGHEQDKKAAISPLSVSWGSNMVKMTRKSFEEYSS